MSNFTHLHLHSAFSILDGLMKPKEIVNKAKECGMSSVAITDFSSMYAAINFYKTAKNAGIKPIMGTEVKIVPKYITNEESGKLDVSQAYNAVLIAKNNDGYRYLMEIISEGYNKGLTSQGRHHIPHVEESFIAERSSGIIMLSGGIDGKAGKAILEGKYEEAKEAMKFWKSVFGDRYMTEISRTGKKVEDTYLPTAVELSTELDIPVVATNDVRFMKKDDFINHEIRVCIQEGQNIEARGYDTPYSPHQYFKTPEEMEDLFRDIPEAIENAKAISEVCEVELTLDQPALPKFPTSKGEDEATYLRTLSKKGLEERLKLIMKDVPENEREEKEKPYWERLDRELEVINNMGFPGYFLIVADFIQWSKRNDIPVGPGRGSGAGSLVAYACKITDIDPLPYDLLFERFLNPERVSMPDFDIDFCKEGRDRVIDYVSRRYGKEAVSQISTFGTMAAKSVIKDVARTSGFNYSFGDRLSRLIPKEAGITLEKALAQSEYLRNEYDQKPEVKRVIDISMALEGLPRSIGRHAAGIVISPTKLSDYTPIHSDGETVASQYDKNDVESAGLVKFDFLGLKNLTTIDNAVKSINRRRDKLNQEPLDITTIPMDDKKAFDLLKDANTTAVFQLESNGMKGVIKKLQPDNFEDIIALVALFRPGPLQSGMVEDFIDRKHGRKAVEYPHPSLEDALKPTYGVIVYQEQVMQIAQQMAGYSLGQADLLRRAMGKKKPEEMAKQKTTFVEGSINQGIEKEKAEEVFELMEYFAGYGFNKSHSAAYALISYQTAYLKAHYPAEFMAAVMSTEIDDTDKLVNFFADFQSGGRKVFPPDINKSGVGFLATNKDNILFGLNAIKGVGDTACQEILRERNENGPFKNMFEFAERVSSKVNKTAFTGLINSGAFDCFGMERGQMLANVENASEWRKKYIKLVKKSKDNPDMDLVDNADIIRPDYEDVAPITYKEKLENEAKSMGVYLSGHPLDEYREEVESIVTSRNIDIDLESHGFKESDPKFFTQVGVVTGVTKKKQMTFFSIDDKTGTVKCTMFKDTSSKYADRIENGTVISVRGKMVEDKYTEQPAIQVREIFSIQELRENHAKQLVVKGDNSLFENKSLMSEVKDYVNQNSPGYSKLLLIQSENGDDSLYQSALPNTIVPNESVVNFLKSKGFSVEVKYEGKELDYSSLSGKKQTPEQEAVSRDEVVSKVKDSMRRIKALLDEAQIEKSEDVRQNSLKRKRVVQQRPS